MGLFNNNRGYMGLDYDCDEIVANENYTHEFGFGQMLVDSAKNDMAIFEALIADDFREVMSVNEGVEFVNEASIGSFIDKIKAFLKNAWEKIKGIIKSFLTKFVAMFIRDNGDLVKKYEKEVKSKTKLGKMKYKWAQINNSYAESLGGNLMDLKDKVSNVSVSDVEDSEFIDKILSDIAGFSTTEADFDQEVWEKMFDEVEEVEGLDTSRLTYIIDVLKTAKETKKAFDKMQKEIDKYFKNALKELDNREKELKKNEDDNKEALTNLNAIYKATTIAQKAINMTLSVVIKAHKFECAQCRRVFIQAAAFNEKAVKEDAILFEAIGECAEFDII